jgi:hypothetical protein
MEKDFIQLQRNGLGFRYFFNAGINPDTCVCDEEGIEVFDQDFNGGWHLIATIPTSKTINDIQEMTDDEFDDFIAQNGIF